MTKKEQRAFLRCLAREVVKAALTKSAAWPDDWDGHELRQLLADDFAHESTLDRKEYGHTDRRARLRRLRDYRNARYSHNI